MRELHRFSAAGTRSENLDRIISSNNSSFIIDGYDCSEIDLDKSIKRMSIDSGPQNSVYMTGPDIKLCLAGIHSINGTSFIYHRGDCRIYSESTGLITDDHSLAWKNISNKCGNRKDVMQLVRKHPCRNILTDYVTTNSKVLPFDIVKNLTGKILLCTDGFWKTFSEEDILKIFQNPENIEDMTRYPNYTDNASVILIEL